MINDATQDNLLDITDVNDATMLEDASHRHTDNDSHLSPFDKAKNRVQHRAQELTSGLINPDRTADTKFGGPKDDGTEILEVSNQKSSLSSERSS